MTSSITAGFVAASLIIAPWVSFPARADNQMGYQLLSQQEAASLPHNHGALGLEVERVQQITDSGMTFAIIGVKQVQRGSAGAQAGFKRGDEIIALDGHVFPTLVTFSDYIGSMPPGSQMTVDYMPAGAGPQKAQRVAVKVGQTGQTGQTGQITGGRTEAPASTGMSTGSKIAIGAGAVALLGCYEMGCFSRHSAPKQPPVQQTDGMPQR